MLRLLYTDHGHEPTIVAIAKRLQATGKRHMVVIVACMRKTARPIHRPGGSKAWRRNVRLPEPAAVLSQRRVQRQSASGKRKACRTSAPSCTNATQGERAERRILGQFERHGDVPRRPQRTRPGPRDEVIPEPRAAVLSAFDVSLKTAVDGRKTHQVAVATEQFERRSITGLELLRSRGNCPENRANTRSALFGSNDNCGF
ncbi:MAG: hypothetical protein ING59_14990 [Burkholderiales bacterium]|nr:hypothetical protein [Burkholderiales bacterium]